MTSSPLSESKFIFVIGLVQFINILDFMMVMPLGPDFARALTIPAHNIGFIGGIYTFSAAFTGLIAALFLDRFNRKKALLFFLVGLIVATACGALSWNFESMLATRIAAGIFGGPLTSLAIAMVADHIPPERRGAAMGKIMGAFAAASVLGVPFGLELARQLSWHAPFIALAAIGCVVFILACRYLPARGNVIRKEPIIDSLRAMGRLIQNPLALSTFAFMSFGMMAGFMIIPNISAHLQINMGYPREHLGILYFFGGLVSFFSMRQVGRWVDTQSSTRINLYATLLLCLSIFLGFVWYHHSVPIVLLFVAFMLAMSSRNVVAQTLSSKVPLANERGIYMSLQSSITHAASASGAFLSSKLLTEAPDGTLAGVPTVGLTAIALSICVPYFTYVTERGLRLRDTQQRA